MKIFYLPTGFTATSTYPSLAGYGPENLENSALKLSWRSADTNNQAAVELAFSSRQIFGIFFYGLNEFTRQTVNNLVLERSPGDEDIIGEIPIVTDPYARYKAKFYPYENGYTGNYTKVRFGFVSGPGSYWEIGAAHVFAGGLPGPNRNPAYGSRLQHIKPVSSDALVNGARPAVITGMDYDRLTLNFDALRTGVSEIDQPEFIWQALSLGYIGLDLQAEDYDFWPMTYENFSADRRFNSYQWDKVDITLREIVTTL